MVFHSLAQYQGRVIAENFDRASEFSPPGFGCVRLARCRAFFVGNWTQATIAKASRCSQTSIRNDCIAFLAFWALGNGIFGVLREKPKTGGRNELHATDRND